MKRWIVTAGLALLLAGCGGGGSDGPPVTPDPDPEVPIALSLTSNIPILRDRAAMLTYTAAPADVEFPRDTTFYVLKVQYSTNDGATWRDATELRTTGAGRQLLVPQEFTLGESHDLEFFWDAEADLRREGADSQALRVLLRVTADQSAGPGIGTSPTLGIEVDWAASAECAVAGPSIQVPDQLIFDEGQRANVALDVSGGDLPLTWSLDRPIRGGLVLDPSGAITGTAELSDELYLLTVTDSCAPHFRKDQQWLRIRVLPPDCEPLEFDPVAGLPIGRVGVPYNFNLDGLLGSNGHGLREWRLASGNLPTGLRIDGGRLTGTPSPATAGLYSVTLRVTDACDPAQREEQSFVLTVSN
ncbi:MAG TPA: Ig domain-containing protein [bacterium]|nr:Ig domain-containing protein [bacterium]